MKILVTGASGFIGGRFARFALEQGFEVRVNGRRAQAVEHLLRRGAQYLEGDLTDPDLARRLCAGVEVVVHCAGATGHWGSQAQVETTENVVEACLKEHVRRLVYVSCADLYFTGRSRREVKEAQLPKRLYDAQARAGRLAEQRVMGAEEFGLEVLTLRPAQVIGAGDVAFMPRLLNKKRLAIVGDGLNKVDFTSVQNLNEALLSAILADETALGRIYNLSNGAPVPLWDAVNYVLRQLQRPQVVDRHRSFGLAYASGAAHEAVCRIWPGRPRPSTSRREARWMNTDFTLDIGQARHYLNYRASVDLWAALDEFSAWWRIQGHA